MSYKQATEAFARWWQSINYERNSEHDAFMAGAEWMREQCAKVAEQAGGDTVSERAHGEYIASRIRDGDKPL